MWSLKNELTGQLFHLLADREYFVGRKDCDITIANDVSISRRHALIKVFHIEKNVCDKLMSTLLIRDMSKFGSKVNDEKINNTEKVLKCNDVLVFGTGISNKFTTVYTPLLVTTSCLTSPQKKEIRKLVYILGGNMVNEWCDGCTHVIMTNLSVTIKVACALISQALIVNVTYLKDLVDTIASGKCSKLPPTEDYLPIMAESQINSYDVSFTPNAGRLSLFVGKVFIFLAKEQFERLHSIIELGGGGCHFVDVSPESQPDKMLESMVLNPNNCVMSPDSNSSSLLFKTITMLLKRSRLRTIPESEVGFAVLYCSTEGYCSSTKNSTSSQNFQGFGESQQKNTEFTQSTSNSNLVKPKDKKIVDYFLIDASDSQQPRCIDKPIVQTPINSSCILECVSMTGPTSESVINCDTHGSETNTLACPKEVNTKPHEISKDKSSTIRSKVSMIKTRVSSTQNEFDDFPTTNFMNANFQDGNFKCEMNLEGLIVVEERNLLRSRQPLNRLSPGDDIDTRELYSARNGAIKNFKRFTKSTKHGKIINDIPVKRYISTSDLMIHVNSNISDGVIRGHGKSEIFDD